MERVSPVGAGAGPLFYRLKQVKGRCYLVKEWYDPILKKKITRSIGPCEWLEAVAKEAKAARRGARGPAPRLVPRPGFEPGSRARKARILGRAILPRPPAWGGAGAGIRTRELTGLRDGPSSPRRGLCSPPPWTARPPRPLALPPCRVAPITLPPSPGSLGAASNTPQ